MKYKKIGILIISRLNSRRLPGKAKLKIGKDHMIEFLIKRLKNYFNDDQIIICTAKNKGKEFYKKLSKKLNIKLYLGANKNVLGRIIGCMERYNLKYFVRVTGDNPLSDPISIKLLIKNHLKNKNDYTFTTSLPWGLRTEVFSLGALKKCLKRIVDPDSTEYLTYFFKRKDIFKTQNVKFKKYYANEQNLSISIDYLKDFNQMNSFLKKNNYNYKIERKTISKFLKKNTQPIQLINKISLKTPQYDVRYKNDKNSKLNLSTQKTS